MQYSLDSPEWRLLQATANRIVSRESAEGLDALSEEERIFFLVWIAEGEVGNGGMHAVCYNSSGNYLSRFSNAFKAIGAYKKAETFDSLIKAFGPQGPSHDLQTRLQQHQTLPDEAIVQIDALDDMYFSAPEAVDALLYHWSAPWAAARLGM